MTRAIVTGAGGLVGSVAVRKLMAEGYEVVGIDNNMRKHFFGERGSTLPIAQQLSKEGATIFQEDVRVAPVIEGIVRRTRPELVIHAAAQPSHDWAARDPVTDLTVNANGTLTVVDAVRRYAPEATFCQISTSKVYGDRPNDLPLVDLDDRFDLREDHPYYNGIDIDMSIDNCLHSLFGVSKAAGDLIVQEYGRYFGLNTVCFRPGCITGPAHQAVELHGFLSYLMKCCTTGDQYTVFGYEGKQVRCNIYADDLVEACLAFHSNPRSGAVYNIGGGRDSACSMIEAVEHCEEITGNALNDRYESKARIGDHKWWISNIARFQADYPSWKPTRNVRELLEEIHDANADAWTSAS